jgi:enoyl-CoA hydratase/carnithine racemase
MAQFVRLEQQEQVAEIVLDRPDKRNALNWDMLVELEAALESVERRGTARAVLVRGEGPGFSAGIDLSQFAGLDEVFGVGWKGRMTDLTRAFQNLVGRFERSPLATIALLHGFVLGLGLELALACDLRLAAEGAKLGLPEARLGLIPDVGGTTRLTRLVGPGRAKALILTGRTIEAGTAEEWGLVSGVAPVAALREQGLALAADIALCAPLAVSAAKRVIDGAADLERGLALEAWAQAGLIGTEDFRRGMEAVTARQAAAWVGR